MNCECNNKSNRVKPGIKHVYGNVLRMAIPLTLRTLTKDGDEMVVTDTDFIPSSDHPVRVVFSRGKTNYPIIATMDGNVAIVEDKGKIPVGTYDISVECYDDLGNPYRFKQNAVLYVADTTAEAGIDEEIEYEAQTWYLNAAVFLATTEIGEIGDAIDAKLDDVFGNVAYDANAKEIRFYNKDNSRVLATIDSRPFIVDGTVADVYIDVSRQVLVVVLNDDAGGTRFSVPLYLVFNSYYKKDEVDSIVSRTEKGLRFDFSQELPLVVHVTKNGSSYSSPVDFGAIENAIREDGRLVVACVNNDIFYQLLVADRAEIAFSRVVALDGYQELLIVDPHNVWSMEDVDLGTGGGGGYEPPAGGIPKTDLASGVQASLNKADTALQQSDLSGYATQDDVDDAISGLVNGAPAALDTLKELADALGDNDDAVAALTNQLANKVDKETGKGLSTNDYTTAEKTKLAGIAAGAEANVQPNWTQTNTSADDYIKNKPTLAEVATSGSYNDLSNKPTIPAAQVQSDWNATSGMGVILNKPTIPDVSTLATKTELNGKQDKINDLASIRINSGKGVADMSSNADGTVVITLANGDTYTIDLNHEHPQYVESDDLADVALSGSYNDLTDKPTIPDTSSFVTTSTLATALQGKADTSDIPTKVSDLTNDSGFTSNAGTITGITMNGASKGTSGVVDLGTVITAHQDISGKANKSEMSVSKGTGTNAGKTTITLTSETGKSATVLDSTHPAASITDANKTAWNNKQSAINDLDTIRSGASKGATAIQQADLAAVATSGSYNDLTNKPTIPAAQVNADWNATSGVSRILNKPTIPTVPTKVSSFTNDAGYLTQHQSLANYYTKSEIDSKIGDIETLLASI